MACPFGFTASGGVEGVDNESTGSGSDTDSALEVEKKKGREKKVKDSKSRTKDKPKDKKEKKKVKIDAAGGEVGPFAGKFTHGQRCRGPSDRICLVHARLGPALPGTSISDHPCLLQGLRVSMCDVRKVCRPSPACRMKNLTMRRTQYAGFTKTRLAFTLSDSAVPLQVHVHVPPAWGILSCACIQRRHCNRPGPTSTSPMSTMPSSMASAFAFNCSQKHMRPCACRSRARLSSRKRRPAFRSWPKSGKEKRLLEAHGVVEGA